MRDTPSRGWAGSFPYLAGLDEPIPCAGKRAQFAVHARFLEQSVDRMSRIVGEQQRRRGFRG